VKRRVAQAMANLYAQFADSGPGWRPVRVGVCTYGHMHMWFANRNKRKCLTLVPRTPPIFFPTSAN
jgi:hypothetical protein